MQRQLRHERFIAQKVACRGKQPCVRGVAKVGAAALLPLRAPFEEANEPAGALCHVYQAAWQAYEQARALQHAASTATASATPPAASSARHA